MELGKEVGGGAEGNEILRGAANTWSQSKGSIKKGDFNCQEHLPELLKTEETAGLATHLLAVPAFLALGAPGAAADPLWA